MRSFILFGLLAAVIGFGSIEASAQEQILKADIPFEFTVGKTTLPAGEYRVKMSQVGSVPRVTIQKADGEAAAIVLTRNIGGRQSKAPGELVFLTVGSKQVLYQIFGGETVGQELSNAGKLYRSEIARRSVLAKPTRS